MTHWQACKEHTRFFTSFCNPETWRTCIGPVKACSHQIRQCSYFGNQFLDFG
ncbi:Uncharacterised protein [Klebsiella pneumoniae]|nr:Uncharacterised protein [Klebsiella pneumoniae]